MSLDPDDPRPPFQQVRSALRAAILTGKIAPGERLATQAELASRYGVAPMTVQQALRLLKDEGLVVGQQGRGTFARSRPEKPAGPRSRVDLAFERPEVRIDFCGESSAPLDDLIAGPVEKVRTGRLEPDSVRVRILLMALTGKSAHPGRDRGPSGSADAIVESAVATRNAIEELGALGLVPNASVQVRGVDSLPGLRLCTLNESEVLHGFASLRQAAEVDESEALWVRYVDDGHPDSTGSRFVAETRAWFEAVWTSLAVER